MNLDDPALLDAYLDGELDPARRLAVESALESSPALAHRLRELSAVRNLVSDLPRPTASFDVSTLVLTEAMANPPGWYRRLAWRRSISLRRVVLGTSLGAAATLLVAVCLTPGRVPPFRGKPAPPRPLVAKATPPAAPKETPTVAEASGARETTPKVALHPAPAFPTNSPGHTDEAEQHRLAEQERLRPFLARKDVRRVVVLTDALDERALGRVDEALKRTHRRRADYARIDLTEGLIIDPAHPGEAVVFAVLAEPRELDLLVTNLRREFSGEPGPQPTPAPVPPTVVTLLADVDRVSFREGEAASALTRLPEDLRAHGTLAERRPAGALAQDVVVPPAPGLRRPGLRASAGEPARPSIGAFGERSRPGTSPADRPERAGTSSETLAEPAAVLVWLTRREPSQR
jgi:hypothetical protein